jgi:branched-chain amino acid aminotransferase
MEPIDLLVEEKFHRAAPGGMGGTKCAGNYSPVLCSQLAAKKHGFADVLYLDALTNSNLEEVSSCNIFIVKGRTVRTPLLRGTILAGVTRDTTLQLLQDGGYDVLEEDINIQDACQADEVFTTGTAVVVASVGSLTYQGMQLHFGI